MSNIYQPSTTDETSDTAGGVAAEAKTQGAHLAQGAADATQHVAGTAKDEATKVASEAKSQAKDLLKQTGAELKEQAGVQQQRVAAGLHAVSDELDSMASSSENGGVATELVQQVSTRAGAVASWLEDRDPGTLLDEVRDFARRRPGAFIGIAAVAGVLAGRLTRSLASGNDSDATGSDAEPAAAAAPTPAPAVLTDATDVPTDGIVTHTVTPVATEYVAPEASAPLDDLERDGAEPVPAAPGAYVVGAPQLSDESTLTPTHFETTSPAEASEYPSEFNGNGELRP